MKLWHYVVLSVIEWHIVEKGTVRRLGFRGIYLITSDEKGRVAIPKRYREILGGLESDDLILTIDTEHPTLLIYPIEIWEEIEAQLIALPSFNEESRRIQRLLIGHASETRCDRNGRILIPGLLRDFAKFEKRLVLLGQGNKLELWSELEWERARAEWITQSRNRRNANGSGEGLEKLVF